MNWIKRIKNLWKLSAYEVELELKDKELPAGTKVSMIVKKPQKMAQIIKRKTPSKEFIEKNPQ